MIRRIAIAVVAAAVLGLLGFFLLAWRPAIAPIEPPNPASFPAESIAKGEILAAAGHCVSCHTRPGGQPFAGGYGVNTQFGISTRPISLPTQRPASGAGRWKLSPAPCARASPATGLTSFRHSLTTAYTKLSDDDVKALYAYLDDSAARKRYGAGEHGSFPPQHPRS